MELKWSGTIELDWVTVLGFAAACFLALFAACKHDPTRRRLAEVFALPTPLEKYHRLLDGFMGFLGRMYGPSRSGWAFAVCLAIAYLYPILFFMLAYACGGPHTIAGARVLPGSGRRWAWLLGFSLFVGLEVLIGVRGQQLDTWVRRRIDRWARPRLTSAALAVPLGLVVATMVAAIGYQVGADAFASSAPVAIAVVVFVVVFVAVFVAVATPDVSVAISLVVALVAAFVSAAAAAAGGAGVFPVAIAVFLAGIGAALVAHNVVFAPAAVVAGVDSVGFGRTVATVVAAALGFAVIFAGAGGLAVALLFVALPVVNAVFDWLSWIVSRHFIARARGAVSPWRIGSDLAFDALVAVGFLVTLALALLGVAVLLDWAYSTATFNWAPLARDARDAPWTKGSTVTFLLVTTLIPTALHLLLGVLACMLHLFRAPRFVAFLKEPFRGTVETGNYLDAFRAAVWLSFNLAVSVALIGAVGYVLIGLPHVPLGRWLYGLVAWVYGIEG